MIILTLVYILKIFNTREVFINQIHMFFFYFLIGKKIYHIFNDLFLIYHIFYYFLIQFMKKEFINFERLIKIH